MTNTKKLIAGNWKMNGLLADGRERALQLAERVGDLAYLGFDMVLCPPATLIAPVAEVLADKNSKITCGGQDCHAEVSGAYTGNISAQMLEDMGCSHVIVGHSERRQYHQESSEAVAAKARAAHAVGLVAIICVGETDAERTSGKAGEVVSKQLALSLPDTATAANTVVAYEPVWAIGTGKTASVDDIAGMHKLIRQAVGQGIKILYGGSVKGSNAPEILHIPDVDGVLVGGASLKVDEFMNIALASIVN